MQTQVHETPPPAPHGAMTEPELDPCDFIRLDRSRIAQVRDAEGNPVVSPQGKIYTTPAYSTVHASEMHPDDPNYFVRYMQDGLPFDANGKLVKDCGRKDKFTGLNAEGKQIQYQPLYTDGMRSIVRKKMARIKAGLMASAPADDDLPEDIAERANKAQSVNLESWLEGDIEYQEFLVYTACKQRFGKACRDVGDVVRFLVNEQRLVSVANVHEKFMGYLEENPRPQQQRRRA